MLHLLFLFVIFNIDLLFDKDTDFNETIFMTVETYQELFYYTAFPVFVTARGTDKIIYKNLACEQYFPKLTKKNLSKLFFASKESHGIGAVKLAGFDAYHTAIALENGDHVVFLFLSHLQSETGLYYANQLLLKIGPTLTDFLVSMKNRKNAGLPASNLFDRGRSLYTETSAMLLAEQDRFMTSTAPLYQLAECICEKMNSAFSDLGYHIHAQLADDFPRYLQTTVPSQEILFVLGRLIYLQMKLSKTKNVKIFLSCDLAFSRHTFQMTTETGLSRLPEGVEENEEWLWKFVPECAMEFLLLHHSGLIDRTNCRGKLDSFGNLTLLYSIPYISPETYYVRSTDSEDPFLLRFINLMLDSIRAKLTDSGASY